MQPRTVTIHSVLLACYKTPSPVTTYKQVTSLLQLRNVVRPVSANLVTISPWGVDSYGGLQPRQNG
ncbi:MAG: hypothetical protein E7153_05735 [Enterococcus faecium]|nr:hypothetical protein [Enterococcus faecium]